MASGTAPTPAQQLIQINWVDNEGRIDNVRVWGYARTISDPLSPVARVDVEVVQSALFGVPAGAATTRALRRLNRKRRREEKEAEEARKRKREEFMWEMGEKAVDMVLKRKAVEEIGGRSTMAVEEAREEEDIPYDPREHHLESEDEDDRGGKRVLRPRDGRLSPIWGLADTEE